MSVASCKFCDFKDSDVIKLDHHLVTKHRSELKLTADVSCRKLVQIPVVACRKFFPFGRPRLEKFYLGSFMKISPKFTPRKLFSGMKIRKLKIGRGCQFCLAASRDSRLEPEDILRAHEMVNKCVQVSLPNPLITRTSSVLLV